MLKNTGLHLQQNDAQQQLVDVSAYGLSAHQKNSFLTAGLLALTDLHSQQCSAYANFIKQFGPHNMEEIEDIPPLSVRMFKELELKSVDEEQVFKTLYSSGTNGQPSKIFLDQSTAKLQSQVLVKILQDWLGKARRPMLLIDSPTTVKKSNTMTARAAGLQGLSFFGRDHTYALDENMQLNLPVVAAFFQQYAEQPILIFGFTFMVWQQFIQALVTADIKFNCHQATLIHGGGWKKLQDKAVSSSVFKQTIAQQLGQVSVHDYYGMVEQTGTIYMECERGHLHCPVWSDILIRNPADLSLCQHHQVGLIQVNSILAQSYPGHCLLTEDLGEILGEDDCGCGRKGKYFKVHGRVPKAETRGCSDTFA